MTGWKWDRRRLEDSRDNRAQYLSNLGGHAVGLRDGTKRDWWQSGVIEGCEYQDIDTKYIEGDHKWTPIVGTGVYGWLFQRRLLYSDYVYTSRMSLDSIDNGLMYKTLRPDYKENTITVALYKRDEFYTAYKYWDFQYVDTFTGELDEASNTRLDTEIDGVIQSANLASRKYEYVIRDDKVVLNGQHSISNTFTTSPGHTEPPLADLSNLFEAHGNGQAFGRNILVDYFPVQKDSVTVWVNENDTLVRYTPVQYLEFSSPDAREFEVDYDLGIIRMGGYQAEDLILMDSLTEFDTEIMVFPDSDRLSAYPERGVIIIDDEEIAYYERTVSGFKHCVRGYNGTMPANHNKGTIIEHRQMGLGTSGKLYVEYSAVPRIEYEITGYGKRTSNNTSWLDIKPISNVETHNILQILPGEISLDSILLETDSSLIGGNLYGPLYYGTDVARLTATGLDGRGNPVQGVELTIEIVSGSGYLNGLATSFSDITNTLGQIYANYNHPLNSGDYEFVVSEVVSDGPDTLMTVPGLVKNTNLDDIWVFQILKFDKSLGTVGLPLTVTDEGSAVLPYGAYYLDLDGVVTDLFRDGVLYIEIAGVKYYRTITWMENLFDGNDVLYTRLYIDAALTGATGDTAYLYEPDAIVWSPALLNGVRVILYEHRNDVLHPLTGAAGAYYPLKPNSIEDNVLRFVDRQLPVPDPEDPSVNLGGYLVVAPSEVSFRASGIDPISGTLVLSNTIRTSLQLPVFFSGVDKTGALPVPTGWRFPTEEHNIGSGIGGSNFITINPSAVGAGQFTLVMEL